MDRYDDVVGEPGGDAYASIVWSLPQERAAAVVELGAIGLEGMLDQIGADLRRIGVEFDVWFREHSLFDDGQYDAAMAALDEGGYTTQRDGAKWFTSTDLGEDKDNVLVRSTGQPTYFASDMAYHRNKLSPPPTGRGFDKFHGTPQQ